MSNFYSDTQTKPSLAMRETVLTADVGDEQRLADATTLELEARVANLLGKQAAVFLPTGTMCNEIAVRAHTQPGDEMIAERSSHIVGIEGGGVAAISGVMVNPIDGKRGTFTGDQVRSATRPRSRYSPPSTLVTVEQTANMSGGTVWPVDQLDDVAAAAREAEMKTHLDGARLLNAVVASDAAADRYCRDMDSCWIDLTKGLGAPVGAVMAGSAEFIEEVWRYKQQWGGAMRQSGVLAAMGLYALDNNVALLADDNARAARIGTELVDMNGIASVIPVDTNIVIFDLADHAPTGPELVEILAAADIEIGAFTDSRCRIVTHLDVDDDDVDRLLEVMESILG